MKMRRPHRVPLARQTLAALEELPSRHRADQYLLPAVTYADRPISENTLNASLRRLGYAKEEVCAHGFRVTASTLLNESGLWSSDAIERQLAHQDSNAVRRAYARGDRWAERVEMMQWWADHLDHLQAQALRR
jgi:integrase